LSGHVIGFAMMATGFAVAGLTFLDGMGGKPPPTWTFDPEGFAKVVVPTRELFYHDLPEGEGNLWVGKITKQSSKAFTQDGDITYPGWMNVPNWFLVTTEDKALPAEAQRMFVQMSKDAGGDIMVREIDSSHSPMLSRPKETVEFILDAVRAFER
jgi:Alpha/beta hydrolase family